ncbi:MAG: LLM class flavin-dependent oxidoreductase [Acidimicrobiia bacterium]
MGLTLPSFQPNPDVVVGVARAAEGAGLDGVFAFDHMWRTTATGERRPALELLTTMAMVAAETTRVTVGSLVARAGLRPAATLAAGFDTLARIAPGRIVAGVGAGDGESDPEDEAFGTVVPDRMAGLERAAGTLRGRGYPVWLGGSSPAMAGLAAAGADGWNLWSAPAGTLAARVADARRYLVAAGRRADDLTFSWGGLAVLGETEAAAEAKLTRLGGRPGLVAGGPERLAASLAGFVAAGVSWVILGPLDPAEPANAFVLAEARGLLA